MGRLTVPSVELMLLPIRAPPSSEDLMFMMVVLRDIYLEKTVAASGGANEGCLSILRYFDESFTEVGALIVSSLKLRLLGFGQPPYFQLRSPLGFRRFIVDSDRECVRVSLPASLRVVFVHESDPLVVHRG